MAKKSLGYVELEWVCPTCNSRNPGSSPSCRTCGAPQPPDVQFEAPAQAQLISDEATVAQLAQTAPDIACPYCRTRNPANAKVCHQCGGDLIGGLVRAAGDKVEGFTLEAQAPVQCTACGAENPPTRTLCHACGAPLPRVRPPVKPKPVAQSSGRGCLLIATAFVLVVVLGVVAMFALGGGERSTIEARVVDTRWTRSIGIEGLVPVRYTAWQDQIPADAAIGACTEAVRRTVEELPHPPPPHREICGTPYAIDRGTGMAEVVTDCVYQLLELRCNYTMNEWQEVDRLVLQGNGLSAAWPAPNLGGRQRPGDRAENYECIFTAGDVIYTYKAPSHATFLTCVPGSRWQLEVTQTGRVTRAVPID